jgi:hypothetical protein
MPDEPKLSAGRSYQMGDVGAGARVAQGENISWTEGLAGLPNGDSLTQQFNALLERIAKDASLDEDTRALAQDKTKAMGPSKHPGDHAALAKAGSTLEIRSNRCPKPAPSVPL